MYRDLGENISGGGKKGIRKKPVTMTNIRESRLGYTGRIVWQYYTKVWYSIGIVNFLKASYTLQKLYQYSSNKY